MVETMPERVKPFSNVSISGGTHGNEMIGIHLVRHWMNNGAAVERRSFKTHLLLSNPRAIEKCVRYTDVDLNRQFSKDPIIPDDKYEVQRACEIQKWVALNKVDYAIDIHNTTSNMGVTLILTSPSATSFQIAASVKEAFDFPVYVLNYTDYLKKNSSQKGGFTHLINNGIGIEVGPLSHGTIKAELFHRSAMVVLKTLDIIEAFNRGEEFQARELEVFDIKKWFKYPLDENGNISGMIHSQLDGQDWKPIKKGDVLFSTFDGKTVNYEEEDVVWPTFIDEAAYVGLAFLATKKVTMRIGAVKRL